MPLFPFETCFRVSTLQPDVDLTLQQIFDKIRVAIYKNRVRSIEFFKDYDRLRSGIITEHQFNSAIVLAIGKEAQLSPPEVQKIIEYYRTPDGRVQYKEFCDMLEHGNDLCSFCDFMVSFCKKNLCVELIL